MAIQQGFTTSFVGELARGIHDLEVDVIKMALYTGSATLGASTTAYSAVNETSGTGYSAGGAVLTNVTVSSDADGAYISFDNPTWPGASFTCRGALIYNSSKADRSVAVLDFGADKQAGPNFTVVLPPNTASTALLRLSY